MSSADASGAIELGDADLVEINPMTVDSNEFDVMRPLHVRLRSKLMGKLRELRAVMRGDDFDRPPRIPDRTGEWRAPIGIPSHRTRIRVVFGVVAFAALVWGIGGIVSLISGANRQKAAPHLVQAARLTLPPREVIAPAAKITPPAEVAAPAPTTAAKGAKGTKLAPPKVAPKAAPKTTKPVAKPAPKAPPKKK